MHLFRLVSSRNHYASRFLPMLIPLASAPCESLRHWPDNMTEADPTAPGEVVVGTSCTTLVFCLSTAQILCDMKVNLEVLASALVHENACFDCSRILAPRNTVDRPSVHATSWGPNTGLCLLSAFPCLWPTLQPFPSGI
jgi:hypothetical protein